MKTEKVVDHIVSWLTYYAKNAGVKGFVVGVSGFFFSFFLARETHSRHRLCSHFHPFARMVMRGRARRGKVVQHVFHLRHVVHDVLDQDQRDGVELEALALALEDFLVAPEKKNIIEQN